jgi:hypothetical protein
MLEKTKKTEIVNAAYVPVVCVFSFGGKLLQYRQNNIKRSEATHSS